MQGRVGLHAASFDRCRGEPAGSPRREKRRPPQGEAAIAEVPAVLAEVLNAHLAGFSKTEWQALRGYLQRMLETGEQLRAAE